MAKVRRRFVRCEAPSCGQGKGAGGAPRMNPCVNAFLTAYLAAPLRGVGFAVFVRLWGVYGRSGGGCRGGGLGLCGREPSEGGYYGRWYLPAGCGVRESLNIFDVSLMCSMVIGEVFDMVDWLYIHIGLGRKGAFLFGFMMAIMIIMLFSGTIAMVWCKECLRVSESSGVAKKCKGKCPEGIIKAEGKSFSGMVQAVCLFRLLFVSMVWAGWSAGWFAVLTAYYRW